VYLLPPSVRDELGEKHLCLFVREVIERLDMSVFELSYSEEGGELYAPQLMLGVWLYAYALGINSARQVERRVVEDLAFRHLAAGERVDNWALSVFRRRHGRALNDAFTQVLEWARGRGMVKLGRVAITRRASRPTPGSPATGFRRWGGTPVKTAWTASRRCATRERDGGGRCAPGRRRPTATMPSRAGWRWSSASWTGRLTNCRAGLNG